MLKIEFFNWSNDYLIKINLANNKFYNFLNIKNTKKSKIEQLYLIVNLHAILPKYERIWVFF